MTPTMAPGRPDAWSRWRLALTVTTSILAALTALAVPTWGRVTSPGSAYSSAVLADSPVYYYRLDETSGTTMASQVNAPGNNGAYTGTVGYNATSLIPTDTADPAIAFDGSTTAAHINSAIASPGPQTFTEEAWFQSTSATGGVIVSFDQAATGTTGSHADRHIWMDNSGVIQFGVCPDNFPPFCLLQTIETTGTYNDGKRHLVDGSVTGTTMSLYIDGALSKTITMSNAGAEQESGYWRIGQDWYNSSGAGAWPNPPTSQFFNGTIDDVAIYGTALSAARVAAHWQAAFGQPTVTAVSPNGGPAGGGTTLTITGTNFIGATGVTVGGTAATAVTVVNATTITATTPAHASGTVDVLVTGPGGTSAANAGDNFTYQSASSTALASSLNPAAFGTSVTYTATVTPAAPVPTGSVTFYDGATALGTAALNGSGVATFATAALAPGVHTITATYGGDTNYATSTSTPVWQYVSAHAWSLGSNSWGDTGIGSSTSTGCSCIPIPTTMTVSPAVLTADGFDDSMVLKPDGTVWAAGYGSNGQMGSGTGTSSTTPVQVPNLTGLTVVALDAGAYGGAVITSAGNVYDWGDNQAGDLGDGTVSSTGCKCKTAVEVKDSTGTSHLANIVKVVGNLNARTALRADGTVWTWGDGGFGELGNGGTANSSLPVQVAGALSGQTVVDIGASFVTDYAVTSTGKLYAWGYNNNGQIGNGTISSTGCSCITTPTQVVGVGGVGTLANITAVSAGGYQVLALSSAGNVYGWGHNDHGQIGSGNITDSSTPVEVVGSGGTGFLSNVKRIAMANATSYALLNNNSLWAWGDNTGGQLALGYSNTTNYTSPVQSDIAGVQTMDVDGEASSDFQFLASGYPSIIGTVAAAPSPGTVGVSETLSVTVTGAGPALTGNVTFYDGVASLGTATLSAGSATLNTTALNAGARSITAVYGGDANYGPSTSLPTALTMNQGTSTTGLATSVTPSVYGQGVTFTATVTVGGPAPTGTVTFKDAGVAIGTGTVSGTTATLATSTLAVGSHSITAVWGGDANYTGSTSVTVTQTVNKASTNATIGAAPNPVVAGQSITFSSTVTPVAPGAGTPTGTVSFYRGSMPPKQDGALVEVPGTNSITLNVPVATQTGDFLIARLVVGTSTSTFSAPAGWVLAVAQSSASVGRVNIWYYPNAPAGITTATFTTSGNAGYLGGQMSLWSGFALSSPLDQTGVSSGGAGTSGTVATSTAMASPSDVGFTIWMTSGGGSPTFSAGAGWAADTTATTNGWTGTSQRHLSINTVASDTATWSPATTGYIAAIATFAVTPHLACTATLSAGSGSCSVIPNGVSLHGVWAVYSGDGNDLGTTSPTATYTVNFDPTTTTIASSSNPSNTGQAVTYTTGVTANAPGSGTPTGTVTFYDGGIAVGACTSVALVSGSATCGQTYGVAGSHTMTVSYSGDANYSTSTSTSLTQTVNTPSSSTAVTTSGTPSTYDSAVTFTATVTFSGPIPTGENVTFCDGGTGGTSCTGGVLLGTGSINSGTGVATYTVTLLGVGTHTILAYYPGDVTYPASSGTVTQVVNAGTLSVVAPAGLNYPSMTPGSSVGPTNIGSLSFTDTLGDGAAWTVKLAATDLYNSGTSTIAVPFTAMTFTIDQAPTGAANASGTLTPGGTPQTLTGTDTPTGTAFSNPILLASGTASTVGTWTMAANKISMIVNATATPGTYTSTIQYTITG